MEKICEERHKGLDKQIETIITRLNNHSERIDASEQKMVAQESTSRHLKEAIESLKVSIDSLITQIGKLNAKPLEKYEKIGMIIITAIVSYFVGSFLGR